MLFRRLAGALQLLGESCFYAYLVVIAERGVRIGVGCGLPRVQDVFEEKTKWNRELWPDRRQLGLGAWVRGGDR